MKVFKERGENLYLWRNRHLNKSRLILFLTLLALAFMLFIINTFPYASVGVVMIPLAYLLGMFSYSRYMLWASGSRGELEVMDSLKKLDDSYLMIGGVVVPPNRGDTDYIVVGRNGIFVIEVKNYGGEISCDEDDWNRRKIGRGGNSYGLEIGSPSNQVKRNAKVLKDFVLEHQREVFRERETPHIWVEGILVFTNKDAELILNAPTVDILNPGELGDFIMKKDAGLVLSEKEVGRIGETIIKHSAR